MWFGFGSIIKFGHIQLGKSDKSTVDVFNINESSVGKSINDEPVNEECWLIC